MESGGPSCAREAKRPRHLPPANTHNVQLPLEVMLRICRFIERRKDRWVVLLALMRSRHGPYLPKLSLRGYHIGEEAAIELAGALQHVPSLYHLDLSWNNIDNKGAIEIARKH